MRRLSTKIVVIHADLGPEISGECSERAMSAEKLAKNVFEFLVSPAAIGTAFTSLGGMSRQLFAMSVIRGRKGWDSRGGAFAKVAVR